MSLMILIALSLTSSVFTVGSTNTVNESNDCLSSTSSPVLLASVKLADSLAQVAILMLTAGLNAGAQFLF